MRYLDSQAETTLYVRIGLITQLVSTEEINEFTYKLADEIAHLAPLTHSRTKKIREVVLRNPSLSGLTQEEIDLPFSNFDSQDFQEGRRAFIERRSPEFQGR